MEGDVLQDHAGHHGQAEGSENSSLLRAGVRAAHQQQQSGQHLAYHNPALALPVVHVAEFLEEGSCVAKLVPIRNFSE